MIDLKKLARLGYRLNPVSNVDMNKPNMVRADPEDYRTIAEAVEEIRALREELRNGLTEVIHHYPEPGLFQDQMRARIAELKQAAKEQ